MFSAFAYFGRLGASIAASSGAPAPPLDPITISLVPSSDSGASDTDNITNVTNPAFDITPGSGFQVGDVFTAYDSGTAIASGTVTQSGYNILSLFMSATSLAQGVHAIQYKQTRGSSQSPLSNTWTLTVRTTAPVLSSPTAVQDGTTWSTADLGVTTNGSDGTLYWVFPTDGTQPTAAQIIAGQDASGAALPSTSKGSIPISSSGAKTAQATNLANGDTRTLFGVHVDIAGNVSNVIASTPLTIVQPLTISGSPTQTVVVNNVYPTATFTASGGTGPYTFSVTAGTLPTGLTFTDNHNGTATISGTPTVVQDETGIVVTVQDSTSATKSVPAFSIDVVGNALWTPTFSISADQGFAPNWVTPSVPLGTGTALVWIYSTHTSNPVTAVTFPGGGAGTKIAAASSSDGCMTAWYGPVNVANGSFTVTCASVATISMCGGLIAGASTPNSGSFNLQSAYSTPGDFTAVTIPTNGIAIAVTGVQSYTTNPFPLAWTGGAIRDAVTESYVTSGNGACIGASHCATAGNFNPTVAFNGNPNFVGWYDSIVVWGV